MKPFTDVQAALQFLQSFEGSARDLRLPIHDSMQDPLGMNMALILDHLLSREWEPDGFQQMDGYRIYKWRALDAT